MENISPLLTTKEAAAYLNISMGALRSLCRRGEISCVFLSHSKYSKIRFSKEDLDRWIKEGGCQ